MAPNMLPGPQKKPSTFFFLQLTRSQSPVLLPPPKKAKKRVNSLLPHPTRVDPRGVLQKEEKRGSKEKKILEGRKKLFVTQAAEKEDRKKK